MNETEQLKQRISDLENVVSGLIKKDRLDLPSKMQSNIINGTTYGTSVYQKIGFYGSSPIVQRSGSAQAAVGTTASTQTTPFGYTTQAQADAIVALVNELRTSLVAIGVIKGSA